MNSPVNEMKIITSQLNQTEERIYELGSKKLEIIQLKENKEKRMKA